MRNWEEAVDYINRIQIVYSNIIEAEKSLRGSLTNADISKINEQFLLLFYSGLSSDLPTLVREQNDLPPAKMYEMVESANQELVNIKRSGHMLFRRRFRHYDSSIPRNRPQKGKWKDQKSDYSRQDSREQFNDKSIPRDSNSRNKEPGIIGDERNLK